MRNPLYRHADFRRLWAGQTISQFGSQVSNLALPLIAVLALKASAFKVSALGAVELLPWLLFALPAGAWIDRVARRPVLVAADAGRALALGSLPIAAAVAHVTYAQLCVVGFATGVLTVFFDVAYQSILPAIVERDQLADGNAKLEISRSIAQTAGPGIGGLLVQLIGAASAITADAASFVGCAFLIRSIRAEEPPVERADQNTTRVRALLGEIREGLSYVLRH
ncbi:MAG: MFS transporter, partial [Actinomycetota bacterium]